jgi:succinate dehydrogenase / fumarate reductase cytochrome b subunit
MLVRKNASTRGIAYQVKAGNKTSAWYSRSMGLLGTLIFLFLILHINHFWVPSRITGGLNPVDVRGVEMHDLYQKMLDVFQTPWVVAVYLLGVFSLAWHLIHGFYSAFQTMGLTMPKYKTVIRNVGIIFTLVICLLFALMPISMYMGWVA